MHCCLIIQIYILCADVFGLVCVCVHLDDLYVKCNLLLKKLNKNSFTLLSLAANGGIFTVFVSLFLKLYLCTG